MNIEIDYNPSPRDSFFISVSVSKKEAISFDYTTKGHRIIRQVLTKEGKASVNPEKKGKPDSEWNTIILENKKFAGKYHAIWYDKGKEDIINDELWETTWEKPMNKELKEKLLFYSHLVSDHHNELNEYQKEMDDFEKLLKKEINKHI